MDAIDILYEIPHLVSISSRLICYIKFLSFLLAFAFPISDLRFA
jgi:hypothetical protein